MIWRGSLALLFLFLDTVRGFQCAHPWHNIMVPSSTTHSSKTALGDSRTALDIVSSAQTASITQITPLMSAIFPAGSSIARALELGAFPALGMNLVTLLGLGSPTPAKIVGALQHFSAGILLTTVAKELLPEMVKAQGLAENVASGVGFFSGVGVLILLGIIFPDEEEGKQTEAEPTESDHVMEEEHMLVEANSTHSPLSHTQPSLRNRKESLRTRAFRPKAEAASDADAISALPTALLAAVAIDSALDGLLIGISTAVDPKTGPLLSASLTVESSFLGLTIAAALRSTNINRAGSVRPFIILLAASLAPVGILTGAISGGGLAPLLKDNNVLLTAFLGFGTSTTLFMVAEELLLQAHEDGSEHTWWVDLQLYTGFFASVMIEKFFGM